jgi:hypothetical protein
MATYGNFITKREIATKAIAAFTLTMLPVKGYHLIKKRCTLPLLH